MRSPLRLTLPLIGQPVGGLDLGHLRAVGAVIPSGFGRALPEPDPLCLGIGLDVLVFLGAPDEDPSHTAPDQFLVDVEAASLASGQKATPVVPAVALLAVRPTFDSVFGP
jgi:hypothetical protein